LDLAANVIKTARVAEASSRNQGLLDCGSPQGCSQRYHQKAKEWLFEIQGAMLKVSVHPCGQG